MTLIYDNNNVGQLLDRIDKISNKAMQIGIFGNEDGEVLLYASVNEFGAPCINIPERSFIRKTFDESQSEIEKTVEELFIRYIDGIIDYDVCMDTIGEYLVGLIKKTIVDMDSPPLKQSTIDAKGSSGVLVDTGRLIDSITYKVVEV